VKSFDAPQRTLGSLDVEAAATLLAAASDIALVLDREGIVRDMACQDESLLSDISGEQTWLGRHLVDVVTVESRAKVQAMLRDVGSNAPQRPRHINHPSSRRADVAILYKAVPIGGDGKIMAFGRDLRPLSDLQYRLVEAQQSMERDYSRLRSVETRYRVLFQESAEPVLVIDANTRRVLESNPAAGMLFGIPAESLTGRLVYDLIEHDTRGRVQSMLDGVKASGRTDDAQAVLAEGGGAARVSASLFRQDGTLFLLVRLSRLATDAPTSVLPKMTWKLLKLVENVPDGFVVTDADGLILYANAAFVDMAELPSDQQARDQSLDRWLGRPGVDLNVLIANLRQHGLVRLYASTVQGSLDTVSNVEVSAVSVMNSERQCLGFAIRNVSRRLTAETRQNPRSLPPSVQHLTELVGRVSLKDLVREATDVIERLSIEATLELTNGNRASAAEMLGVSRQSLYVKLRRYGMIDSGDAELDG
jgi:transcriptional regulator PpsR